MTTRRKIATIAGGVTALAVFLAAMWLLIFGGYFKGSEIVVYVSIALGPVLMIAVMAGYAVWWLAMFLMTLVSRDQDLPRES